MGIYKVTKVSRGASRSSEAVCQQAPLHCSRRPLLWHTEILWRQYEEKEDAAQVVPAMEVPWAMLLQRAMKSWRPLPNAPSLSMASGRKPRPSCWQAGPYFWRLRFSASLAACPARQEVYTSSSLCQRVNVLRNNAHVRDNGLSRVDVRIGGNNRNESRAVLCSQ